MIEIQKELSNQPSAISYQKYLLDLRPKYQFIREAWNELLYNY
jgi:hypothetical protein